MACREDMAREWLWGAGEEASTLKMASSPIPICFPLKVCLNPPPPLRGADVGRKLIIVKGCRL